MIMEKDSELFIGERHEGQFHNGKPIGKHKKYLNDGKIEEIDY